MNFLAPLSAVTSLELLETHSGEPHTGCMQVKWVTQNLAQSKGCDTQDSNNVRALGSEAGQIPPTGPASLPPRGSPVSPTQPWGAEPRWPPFPICLPLAPSLSLPLTSVIS